MSRSNNSKSLANCSTYTNINEKLHQTHLHKSQIIHTNSWITVPIALWFWYRKASLKSVATHRGRCLLCRGTSCGGMGGIFPAPVLPFFECVSCFHPATVPKLAVHDYRTSDSKCSIELSIRDTTFHAQNK